MSKLGYAVKRAMKMDWKKMRQTADMLHEKTGKSRAWLMQDMLRCALRYNAGYMDYKIAAMYKLNDAQRRTVITRGISNNIVRRMNDKAYWHYFDDKTTFNTLFAPYIGRKWIKVDDSLTADALAEFLSDLPAALFKPLEGSSGVGIVKYNKADWEKDIPAFLNTLRAQGAGLLEELLVQHPEMSRLCPTSVNTVRIATLLGDKREGVVYAFLRIGNGKVMDNVDQGGMAARVDLATGKLLTVAADKAGNVYDKHPITGTPIVGFTIPYLKKPWICACRPCTRCRRCALWPGMWLLRPTARALSRAIPSPATLCRSLRRTIPMALVFCRSSASLSISNPQSLT